MVDPEDGPGIQHSVPSIASKIKLDRISDGTATTRSFPGSSQHLGKQVFGQIRKGIS